MQTSGFGDRFAERSFSKTMKLQNEPETLDSDMDARAVAYLGFLDVCPSGNGCSARRVEGVDRNSAVVLGTFII